jgi:hypothetical protein
MYFQKEKSLLEEKSIRMDGLNQEVKRKKEELNRAMTEKMEQGRKEKEVREQLNMVQYEANRCEEDLRRLTSKVLKTFYIFYLFFRPL